MLSLVITIIMRYRLCHPRRSNQSILKEINPGISLKGMMLKLKLQYFDHLMLRVGVGAEGVVNSPRKKVTVDMGLEGQEGICPRDEIRGGRKWHFKWRDWLGQRSCALNNIWSVQSLS